MISALIENNQAKGTEELLQELESCKQQLAVEVSANQELHEEITALYRQFEALKQQIEIQKEKHSKQIQLTEEAHKAAVKAEEKIEKLQTAFNGRQEEIIFIKQKPSKDVRDTKDLENRYREAIVEKNEFLKTIKQQQNEYEKQQKDLIDIKKKFKEKQQSFTVRERQADLIKLQLGALEVERDELVEKLDLLHLKSECLESERNALQNEKAELEKSKVEDSLLTQQLSEQLESSIHERELLASQYLNLEEEFALQSAFREEKEIQLEEARQHFAKKMREVAHMQEKVEEYSQKVEEHAAHQKRLELENDAFDSDLQKSEEKNKALLDKITLLEIEIKRREQDWHSVDRQRQTAEERVAELIKIEQCHAQLQSLLLGFGKSDAKPISLIPPPLQFGVLPQEEPANVKENEVVKPYAYLFDFPQAPARPKQTLFE